jgi:hypothetical protein
MATCPQHRGPHPEDRELFAPDAIDRLREACSDASWLLGRGYTADSVLDVVGRRYQLRARQRLAIQRSMCSPEQAEARSRRRLDASGLSGKTLQIDGFNLIIGIEVALSGGVLLRGLDGTWRDLAGLRGSYRLVEETDTALDVLGHRLCELRVNGAQFFLDAPVSNSGRLKTRIRERAAGWGLRVDVDLVSDPDAVLAGRECVVSNDSLVIDRAVSWVNLLDDLIRSHLPAAWLVDLRSAPDGP